jgi:hypothetical protein
MRVAFFEVKHWKKAFLSERLPPGQVYFSPGPLAILTEELPGLETDFVCIYSHAPREVPFSGEQTLRRAN